MKDNNFNYFIQQTDRLYFRKLQASDIPLWSDFFRDNEMIEFVGIDTSKEPLDLSKEWIEKQFERYQNDGFGHLAIIEKKTNRFLGVAGLIVREIDSIKEFEVSYLLKKEFWGKGYATEITKSLIDYSRENKVSKRLISLIHKENLNSIRVAKKNNMTIVGEIINYLDMDVFIFAVEII